MSYYDNNTILYLDGNFSKATDVSTDIYSASLHYGYAVFEGIRAYKTVQGDTAVFKAEEHYERLKVSAESVGIPYPYDNKQLIEATYSLLKRNGLQDAYIRPLVYCPPNMTLEYAKASHIMIAVWNWGAYLGDRQLKVMTSSFQRPNPGAFKIHAKVSGHYVNSIMASQEAKSKGYDEALLLDSNGYVAEGPGANVFYEKGGNLYTTALGNILPGITRATVLELCREMDIEVSETLFTIDELKNADSVFYCGTAAEIIGWQSLDDVIFPMSWEASLGRKIQAAYKRRVLKAEEVTA